MKNKLFKCLSVFAVAAAVTCMSAGVVTAHAEEDAVTENLAYLETRLDENDTDVVSELQALIGKYRLLDEDGTDENIQRLIASAEQAITDYISYKNGAQTYGIIGNAVYKAAVSTAVAYFNSNDYDLSAELLLHARDNGELDSVYEPEYGYLVTHSTVFQNIAYGTSVSGSASFPNSGDYIDKDLYYSIHAFSYTKPSSDSTTVVLSDRYDFAEEDNISSVVDLAVGIMYKAQQAGVITPFLVSITQTV